MKPITQRTQAMLITLLVVSSLLWGPVWAGAQELSVAVKEAKTIKRYFDPVEISLAPFTQFYGKPVANVRLYSCQNGNWQMIALQIDERNQMMDFAMLDGDEPNPQDANNLVDKQDLLVFMARDLGDRVVASPWPANQTIMEEIKFIDPKDNKTGWCYLVYFFANPPKMNFKPLVEMKDEGRYILDGYSYHLEGMRNEVRGHVYKIAFVEKLWIPKRAGGSGVQFLDRMKVRGRARLVFGMVSINLNENTFSGGIFAGKRGLIRVLGRMWASTPLPMNIRGPYLALDVYAYDTAFLIPFIAHPPFNPGLVVTDITFKYGWDHNQAAAGMKFYNSNNLKGFNIDGHMDQDEKNMIKSVDKWRMVTGPQGTILNTAVWDPDWVAQCKKVEIGYLDDINDRNPPESVPGSMGFHYSDATVKNLKARRDYYSLLGVFFPPNFYDPNRFKTELIDQYMDIVHNPIKYEVAGKTGTNNNRPNKLHPHKSFAAE